MGISAYCSHLLRKRPKRISSEQFLAARCSGRSAVESEFLSTFRLRNGVYKTTMPERLADTDGVVATSLRNAGWRSIRVLDVACSSGVSTAELHRALQDHGLEVETIGTDLMLSLTRVEDRLAHFLFMKDAHLLQVEMGELAIRWPPMRSDWVLHPAQTLLATVLKTIRGRACRACLSAPRPAFQVTTIPLTARLTESVPGLSLVEEDILHPLPLGRFHFVRAANVLNRGYFGPELLGQMAACLWARVLVGGELLVVRTVESGNQGTLFRRTEAGAQIVDRFGLGSEVEEIVLGRSRPAGPGLRRGVAS